MDTYMFLTSAASKTKRAIGRSPLGGGGGGGANIARHCVCNSLFKSLSQWGQTCSYVYNSLLVDLSEGLN